jgi:uncharacterized NAD(P)/FAD-binding protein YdhS
MPSLSRGLAELARKLDALGPRPSSLDLAHAIEKANVTAEDVGPFVRVGLQSYNRAPVVVCEHYEMLVLTWGPGQSSVPHEHSGSVCVVRVIQGRASEGSFSIAADGFADLEYEETLQAGQVTSLHDAGVHTIRNASEDGELLVTLHVYAPPLREGRRFVPRPAPRPESHWSVADGIPTIAIVGGGFSGSMTASHILTAATCPIRIVLIERRGAVGEGVAYATREAAHILNVPASNMSAWPDRPDDFVQWALRRHEEIASTDFLPRQWYGEYIRDTLVGAARRPDADLSIVFDEVRRIAKKAGAGWMLHLARGESLRADAVVLAVGHCPPSDPIGAKWIGPKTRFVTDPWRSFAMSSIRGDEAVVILGSGLTALDTILSLTEYPRSAKITLVSVNGLMPQGHAESPIPLANLNELVSTLRSAPGGVRAWPLFRALRKLARESGATGHDWRPIIDGLRPHTKDLWRGMSHKERRRFLSRLRPFWEIHRHRTAPRVSARFRSMLQGGQVELIAGRVESVHAKRDEVRVLVRLRRTRRAAEISAGWVVNCTGPLPSNRAESNPAIGSLMARGHLSADALALGLETTDGGNAVAADGSEVPDVFVVGTLRKPAYWESTAVPELREQAAEVARNVLRLLEPAAKDTDFDRRVEPAAQLQSG